MFNFDFGPISNRAVTFSPCGLAVLNQNTNKYVAYDKEKNCIFDVENLNIDMQNIAYKIPTAISTVVAGDIIIHNGHFCFVTKAKENSFEVVDITTGDIKTILPTRSPFGFNFITKVISIMDNFNTKADEENPFGNLLPFVLLNNENYNQNTILPLILMSMNKDRGFANNPLMLWALTSQGENRDNLLPLLFMSKDFTF